MKRVILGLFAIVIAVSASAFTSKGDIEKTLAPIVYHNSGSGVYTLGSGTCNIDDTNRCLQTFSNPNNVTTPPATFNIATPPTNLGTRTPSGALARQ